VKGENDYDGLLGMIFLSVHLFDLDKKIKLLGKNNCDDKI